MIRRDVLRPDNRTVKWSLVAGGFALSLGMYAEHVVTSQIEEETTTAVVQKAVPAPAPAVIAG